MTHDVVIIGGGVNGLVCAASLAGSGLQTLVLEQLDTAGGGAATSEIAPGFHVPTYAHQTGPFRQDVADALGLDAHGVVFTGGGVDITALAPDGRALVVYDAVARTADGLRAFSMADADAWPEFVRTRAALARVLASLFSTGPPDIDALAGRDIWNLLKTLRHFRGLSKADQYRLLRWAPMPAHDLLHECFNTGLLCAGLAGDAVFGTMFGPRSAGSGMALLLRAANDALAVPGGRFVRGGPGRLAAALVAALRAAGGEIRTGAGVARIMVDDDGATGVVLADGETISSRAVVSALDPRRTFLTLCDPVRLSPELLWRMRNYRAHGTLAKVNLALSALPSFRGGVMPESLTGRVRLGGSLDAIERAFDHAKYGRFSPEPWIELTLPTLLDPSLAPSGGHVLSAYVQFAPYRLRDGDWDAEREALGDAAVATLEHYAPGISRLIVAREVLTPLDLERRLGMTGGHIFHGELAIDQLFLMRPLLGFGQYRSPIDGLFLCGSGTHPGTGLTGGSGWLAAKTIAAWFD